jgi:hypothetical protein
VQGLQFLDYGIFFFVLTYLTGWIAIVPLCSINST